jgi:ectoine hydroxylase-related dioxygenase (phytanoyl-CoA dioxygenase family)
LEFDADVFERDGFFFSDSLIDAAASRAIIAQLDLQENRAGQRHLIDHPAVIQLLANPALVKLISSALGCNAFAYKATLFDKSTDANWLVAWHQDISIPVANRCELPMWNGWSVKDGVNYVQPPSEVLSSLVALRIHLDECTTSSGPLRVLKASHTLGRVPHEQCAAFVASHEEQVVTGGMGSALLLRPLLIHASSKANASERRRVLHLEFAACELPHGLQWKRQLVLSNRIFGG